MGYNDVSMYNGGAADGSLLTPHIDGIGKAGAKFMAGYAGNAVCAPSRSRMNPTHSHGTPHSLPRPKHAGQTQVISPPCTQREHHDRSVLHSLRFRVHPVPPGGRHAGQMEQPDESDKLLRPDQRGWAERVWIAVSCG